MGKEVVTVQIGAQANAIGAQFWALQAATLPHGTDAERSELDASALFQEYAFVGGDGGEGASEWRPRLQLIDASGAFGALSTQTGEYDRMPELGDGEFDNGGEDEDADDGEQHGASTWSGRTAVYRREAPASAHDASSWSSQLRASGVSLHARSLHALRGVHADVSDLSSFGSGAFGARTGDSDAVVGCARLTELFDDGLRPWVEACDSFGGLLVLADADSAFARLAASYVPFALDELDASSASPALLFCAHARDRTYGRALHGADAARARGEALLATAVAEHGVQAVALPRAPLQSVLPDRSADTEDGRLLVDACLAAGLDVATTPVRQRGPLSLAGLLSCVRRASGDLTSSLLLNSDVAQQQVATARRRHGSLRASAAASAPVFARSLLGTPGTVNLSNAWNKQLFGKFGASAAVMPIAASQESARAVEAVSARGVAVAAPLRALAATRARMLVPGAMPPVVHALAPWSAPPAPAAAPKGGRADDSLAAVGALASVPPDARAALSALADVLRVPSAVVRAEGLGDQDVEGARETLLSRADDCLDY